MTIIDRLIQEYQDLEKEWDKLLDERTALDFDTYEWHRADVRMNDKMAEMDAVMAKMDRQLKWLMTSYTQKELVDNPDASVEITIQ